MSIDKAQELFKQGNFTEGIKVFQLLAENDRTAQNFYNLGIAYEKTGNITKAKEAYDSAIVIDSTYTKAQNRLIEINAKIAQIQGNKSFVSQTIGNVPSYIPPQTNTNNHPPVFNSQQQQIYTRKPAAKVSSVNWGACLLTFPWCIAHLAWLWLIGFILLGPIISIILLFMGNDVAREKRWFDDQEHFAEVQNKWALASLIIWGILILLYMILMLVGVFVGTSSGYSNPGIIL